MSRLTHASLAASAVVLALALAACDEPSKTGPTATTASATASTQQAAPPAPPKPKGMPEILVDADGPYLDGQRVNMTTPEGAAKLTKIVKGLPINGQPVTLIAEKKAKTPYVAAVVAELGDAGAPKVTIKTDGRDDLPKEIVVTPESKLSSAPAGCSVSAVVLKDLATAVWPFRGGLGKRHSKGFAGPDLSHTSDQLKKDIAACDSPVAVFSADDAILWEMTYNLAGTIKVSDEKKKIETMVLPRESPVAGRPVVFGKKPE